MFRPLNIIISWTIALSGSPVLAFPGADHQWVAPDSNTQARSPCPGLNTAADHGFLPRSGTNISIPYIGQVLEDVFSLNQTATMMVFQTFFIFGLRTDTNEDGEKVLRSLQDLYDDRFLHDASFVHEDPGIVGDFPPTNLTLWEQLKAASSDGQVLTHEDMLKHQIFRAHASLRNNPDAKPNSLTSKYVRNALAGEKMFMLLGAGGQSDTLQYITLEDAEDFLVHNRLPQGFVPRQARTLPSSIPAVVDFQTDFSAEIRDYFYDGILNGLSEDDEDDEETVEYAGEEGDTPITGDVLQESSGGESTLSLLLLNPVYLVSVSLPWLVGVMMV